MSEQQAREERALIERIESSEVEAYADLLLHAAGWEERVLRMHLGDEAYGRQRARCLRHRGDAAGRPAAPRGNVVVLPGLMGSDLALVDAAGRKQRLWIDPFQLALGGMEKLRLAPSGLDGNPHDVRATGISKLVYGELLLALSERWNVRAFWYDWRKDLKISASQLAAAIDEWFPETEPVHFVAHSMGGLVARTFIALHPHRWNRLPGSRLVMLGTPNHGSFLVPQALSGVAQLLRLLALVDVRHSPAELARIVGSFVGLVQMLPEASVFESVQPLYQKGTYSPDLEVSQHHLDMAARHHELLRDVVDERRMINVAGAGRATAVGVTMNDLLLGAPGDGIERYSMSTGGDGTVPHASVRLRADGKPEVTTYYLDEAHATLPRNDLLLNTIHALLGDGGEGVALPLSPPVRREEERTPDVLLEQVRAQRKDSEQHMRTLSSRLRTWGGADMAAAQVGTTSREVEVQLIHHATGVPRDGGRKTVVHVPIDLPSISLRVIPGDIAALDDIAALTGDGGSPVDAIALSHYAGGAPGQMLCAIDQAVSRALARAAGGAAEGCDLPASDLLLTQYIERGIVRGSLGQIFFVEDPRPGAAGAPSGRTLAIAGMGFKPSFGPPEAMIVVRELCWALGRLGKQHLVTGLFGSGRGNLSVEDAVSAWIRGIKHAITGERWPLRRITFVERDPARVDEIARAIEHQKAELDAKRNRIKIDFERLPNGSYTNSIQRDEAEGPGEEMRNAARISVALAGESYRFGAVTAGASIPERDIPADPRLIEQANDELMLEDDEEPQVERGRFLTRLLFPRDFNPAIFSGSTLILQLDATTARLHWELATEPDPTGGGPSDQFLGITRGLTRQLRTRFAPPPDPPPPPQRLLRVMVIADPAEDAHLPGAQEEGIAVADLFERFNEVYRDTKCRVEVHRFFGPHEATRTTVLRELMLRTWDVLHFAGHCAYDRKNPPASGWVFTHGERISARELSRLDRIPRFVFSNACESGVTPDRAEQRSLDLAPSFAESFFQRGVANFVCTAWPVDDVAARQFAIELYGRLLGIDAHGPTRLSPMFEAMKHARRRVAETAREEGAPAGGARTWGAYQHYGNPFSHLFDEAALTRQREEIRGKSGL